MNGSCSTMQKRCLCRRFVRKFHNVVFYVVCLAFHRWCQAVVIIVSRFTVNGIAVPLGADHLTLEGGGDG